MSRRFVMTSSPKRVRCPSTSMDTVRLLCHRSAHDITQVHYASQMIPSARSSALIAVKAGGTWVVRQLLRQSIRFSDTRRRKLRNFAVYLRVNFTAKTPPKKSR